MSYRDLRNFTEMMRVLGFTRLISTENFRNPNFPLVAEILIWLIKRFDPEAEIPTDYNTESERVVMIRFAAQFMASKLNVKVNTKNLYQADGYAVRELIKPTTVLYNALRTNARISEESTSNINTTFDVSVKASDIKRIRVLASEITAKGAILYDLLGKEVEMREIRNHRVGRQLELGEVEEAMRKAIEILKSDINNIKQLLENVSSNEATLDSKIEKKRIELERNQKRLLTLKKVRPAFMEEFERLEAEMRHLFAEYLTRFRSLAYLEQQQEDTEQAEQERILEQQVATKRLIEKMKKEEKLTDDSNDLLLGEIKDDQEVRKTLGKTSRVRIQTASRAMRKASAHHVFGSMNGPTEDDDDSLDSDSDLLLDGDGSELLGSDEEDEEVLALGVDQHVNATDLHSDDDF